MYIIIYKICQCSYILFSFVKLLFDTKIIIIMRKHKKIIKKVIFALFLVQKIKFEEIRKNCSYIIIYRSSYVIIYEQFFFIFF